MSPNPDFVSQVKDTWTSDDHKHGPQKLFLMKDGTYTLQTGGARQEVSEEVASQWLHARGFTPNYGRKR